jgi:DNA-binding IclR family transcriptional regulator
MTADLVKSAARALEILEVFADRRERLSSTQIGAILGYPKSSLSVLLKSLVAQGYLSNGDGDQDYFPTLKLARLGDWLPTALLGSETLLPTLEKLRDMTGETVTLTTAIDLQMRCMHALIGTHPISLQIAEGTTFPILDTAIGTMYLATQPEATAKRLFDAWVAHGHGSKKSWPALLERIGRARDEGHVTAYDAVLPDTGAIAMPIRAGMGDEVLMVAVAGLSRRIAQRENEIIRAMRKMLPGYELES